MVALWRELLQVGTSHLEYPPEIDRYLSSIKIMIRQQSFLLTNNEILIYCHHVQETAFNPNRQRSSEGDQETRDRLGNTAQRPF